MLMSNIHYNITNYNTKQSCREETDWGEKCCCRGV